MPPGLGDVIRLAMGHPTDIFVPELSSAFVCAICHDVLKDASTFRECGHSFCRSCITNYLAVQTLARVACPNCRTAVTGSNPNYALREIVESMPARCPEWISSDAARKRKREDGGNEATATAGCDWQGLLKDLKSHESKCPFKVITCNVVGCNHKCQRRDMASHHESSAGTLMHAELRHHAQIQAVELRCENRIKSIESKYKHDIQQMELRYVNLAAAIQTTIDLRNEEHELKLEKKLKKEMKELEARIYLTIGKSGRHLRSQEDGSEVDEQASGAYGLNYAVFRYIKTEGGEQEVSCCFS